jgi:CDP-diacylglycerol--glycerol-3-phosphate 3-phosphatidyltransferase
LGKILDPFADSLSRLTYFICFTAAHLMPFYILIIIIYRDFSVSFIRLLMIQRGVVMGARLSGKIKAWVYAIAGIGGMLRLSQNLWAFFNSSTFNCIIDLIFIICGLVALITLFDYIRPLFASKKQV